MKRRKQRSRGWDCKTFNDILFDMAPSFDAEILKSYHGKYLHALRVDVRLLGNKLRKFYSKHEYGWNRRRQSKKTKALVERCRSMLDERLPKWLNTLDKKTRRRERKKRWFSDANSSVWIGKIKTMPWDSFSTHRKP